jgi:hypothetical protein
VFFCCLFAGVLCRTRCFHHTAFAAGAASAADSAAGAVATAGTFACFPVTDYAADQQSRDQHNNGNKDNIDQICGKPG